MATIVGAGLSSYNHIVATGSDKSEILESAAYESHRKRKLRSEDLNLLYEYPISTPKKLKSRRQIAVSNSRTTTETEVKQDSNENLADSVNLAVEEDISDCLGSKSNWNPRDEEKMRAVKEALHVSKAPSSVVCREDEQMRVFEFVKGCLDQDKAGSLYICGCPGTGKSLSIDRVVQQVGDWSKQAGLAPVDTLSVNCTSLTKTTDIFSKVLPYVAFQSNALELCARKVAAASGDMRKALSVCRSAIEILEIELRGSPGRESQSPTPVVRMDHMAAALSKTFKSPVVDTIQSLPQHQQIIICSAAKAFRGSKKDATIGELNKIYLEICKSWVISPAGITDFTNMCTVLNDQGILKFCQARRDKLTRVSLRVDESDITFALQGIRLFRNSLL